MKIRIAVSKEKYEFVERCLTEHGIEIDDEAEFMITESSGRSAFLPVRSYEGGHERLSTDEIIYIEAFGKDIEVRTMRGTYLSRDRMYQLETLLAPQEFLRISKSVIISKKHVKKIRSSLSMKYILTMSDGTLVDVTRSYYSDFRRFFGI